MCWSLLGQRDRKDGGSGRREHGEAGLGNGGMWQGLGCRKQRRGREGRRSVSKSTNCFSSFGASKDFLGLTDQTVFSAT